MIKKVLPFLIILIMFSCQKEIVYDENPFLIKKNELDFKNLSTTNPVIYPGREALLTATATGDELVFSWSAEEGTLTAADTIALFSHQAEGEYLIICTISDKYGNEESKEVIIHVTPELVFTSLKSEEDVIPRNFHVNILATASGEELVYEWETDGGNLEGSGPVAGFSASQAGTYTISCTVSDLLGEVQSLTVVVNVVEGFVYKSLTADPERMPANENSNLTASALGENLKYTWKCDPPANLLGSGNKIIFNICHADTFVITCEISDMNGNTQTQSVTIIVTD